MLETPRARDGMVTAPHHLAAQAGLDILKAGGNAVEAAIAVAATLAVVYPHMTGIGGDGFWLVAEPGQAPVAIDACGRAASACDPGFLCQPRSRRRCPGEGRWLPIPWPELSRDGMPHARSPATGAAPAPGPPARGGYRPMRSRVLP